MFEEQRISILIGISRQIARNVIIAQDRPVSSRIALGTGTKRR